MIKQQEVKHIAKLARIKLTASEIKKFQKDLSSILDYFELLKEVDVSRVEPTFHSTEHFLKNKLNIMREDKAESQLVEDVAT
ncbi:MAG: Asp-tRNA(Asn)/Glu-tRNA(Gln) amidotransferase subunit GatC, partial [Candidatus Nealsonbacteria bacterium]|nr:Asp-tRNA(Asn)/Glu-tRNA(Gln) amidotransferase subunit GatC [Candidatus Nealsonbacteria bacterium]